MSIPFQKFDKYRTARKSLLTELDVSNSNRDPLSEMSEVIAAVVLKAKKPSSRVNKGYDLTGPDGEHIEVKYLANLVNEKGRIDWKNWHNVTFDKEDRDKYALVVYLNLDPTAMFVFSRDKIRDVCQKLGKRHKNQEWMLSLTLTDFSKLRKEPEDFADLGVQVFDNLRERYQGKE